MIELREYETYTVPWPALPAKAVRDRLALELKDRLEMAWLVDGQLRIRAREWVGVVRIGSTSVRILPKLAGDDLDVLTMLALVSGVPLAELPSLDRQVSVGRSGELLEMICRLLCREARAVLAAGPLQDYRVTSDDLAVLRGRLEIHRQATRHFGRVDVLACRYQEFDHDVVDNQLLREGLAVARTAAVDASVRAEATGLFGSFQQIAPGRCPQPAELRRQLQYDRRNQHYRQGHVWALALLEGHRLNEPFRDEGERTSVFLLNMNRQFESFVEWLLAAAFRGTGFTVVPQYRDSSILWHGGHRWGSIRPDVLLRHHDGDLAVDAKYKRYDLKRVAVGDLYQLFLYCQAYRGLGDTPTALLVYPSVGLAEDITIDLRPHAAVEAKVECFGIALPALLESMRRTDDVELKLLATRLHRATMRPLEWQPP